jgi:hypothetical protein
MPSSSLSAKLLYTLYIVDALNVLDLNENCAFHFVQTLAHAEGCQHFANHPHVNIHFYSPLAPLLHVQTQYILICFRNRYIYKRRNCFIKVLIWLIAFKAVKSFCKYTKYCSAKSKIFSSSICQLKSSFVIQQHILIWSISVRYSWQSALFLGSVRMTTHAQWPTPAILMNFRLR